MYVKKSSFPSLTPNEIYFIILLVFIVFLLLAIFPPSCNAKEIKIDVRIHEMLLSADCLECHGGTINGPKYLNSVHGSHACTSCHRDVIDLGKHKTGVYVPRKVECGLCHEKEAEQFKRSVHFLKAKFACSACHSDVHYVEPWDKEKVRIVDKCTQCHARKDYVESGHDKAILRGNNDAASCADCHGLHDTKVFHTAGKEYPVEARAFYTRVCYRCHSDKVLMKRNNLTTIAVETYEQTTHAKIQKLGYPAAGCADCHAFHNILPKSDPKSTVNQKNLVKICGNCHKNPSNNFVKYIAHPNLRDRERYPLLFWTRVFMVSLLVVVLLFYWIHTFLWWRKAYWEKQRRLRNGHLISEKLTHVENPGETYMRFKLRDRLLHLFGILLFFGLATTGLPLKFPEIEISKIFLKIIGGIDVSLFIHRICALALIMEFIIVLIYCFHFIFLNRRAGATLAERITGPYSLLPTKKDWHDFKMMVNWFLDQGPPPRFDHWTYWEKFDFLAVFWGMVAIGFTGIILMSPELTTKYLPGWTINLARIIHSEEALLAVGFVFTVHFFNTHFVPTKWPMNYSIFTGRIYKWEFLEDRPLEYERLEKTGELEKLKCEFPHIVTNFVSGVVGLSALVIGLITIVFIFVAIF